MVYEFLSIMPGFNGSKFYVIGNTSTYHQAWPVEIWSTMELAQASIDRHNGVVQK